MNVAANPTIELPTDSTPVALAAEMYACIGFSPVRLYGMANGRCACGNPNCEPRSWAKHPIIKAWQKQATSDLDAVRDSFRGHGGNIGILLGERFVVIDVDGPEGAESLERLSEEIAWPETLTARTGSGGMHMIFQYARHQDPNAVTNRRFAPGLDVKTRGGQFVAAPSLHRSGNRYQWTVAVMPAVLPDALYDRIRAPETKAAVIPLRNADPSELLKRARAYLDKIPPAVSGSQGHKQAFSAARALTGFVRRGLSESDAWYLLVEYNARCEPRWTEAELRHKWSEAQKATSVPSIEDRPAPVSRIHARRQDADEPVTAPAADGDEAWKSELLYKADRKGQAVMRNCHANVTVILRRDPLWRGRVKYNEFTNKISVTDPPWHAADSHGGSTGTHEWLETDHARLCSWVLREHGLEVSVIDCERAVNIAAEADRFHPVREYMQSLRWDGTSRLDTFARDYLGAEDTPYHAAVVTWWLISAVARVCRPGCKADHVLILAGDQGAGKSSAIKALVPVEEWFFESGIRLDSKEGYETIQGQFIIELQELDAMSKVDDGRLKAFFSAMTDVYRPSFGRALISRPRQCVFTGTSNQRTFLRDPTGNRRYWTVVCTATSVEAIKRDRDQIWAEAVARFEAGHRWYPNTPEEHDLCADAAEEHTVVDEWEPKIADYLGRYPEPSIGDILAHALGLDPGKWGRTEQMRASFALQRLGYERFRKREGELLAWRYRKRFDRRNETCQPACSPE